MKRNRVTCLWEWVNDTIRGGFKIKCDFGYIWEYRKKDVISDFQFCPNCGKRVEFIGASLGRTFGKR